MPFRWSFLLYGRSLNLGGILLLVPDPSFLGLPQQLCQTHQRRGVCHTNVGMGTPTYLLAVALRHRHRRSVAGFAHLAVKPRVLCVYGVSCTQSDVPTRKGLLAVYHFMFNARDTALHTEECSTFVVCVCAQPFLMCTARQSSALTLAAASSPVAPTMAV